jgi:hypothetical protein
MMEASVMEQSDYDCSLHQQKKAGESVKTRPLHFLALNAWRGDLPSLVCDQSNQEILEIAQNSIVNTWAFSPVIALSIACCVAGNFDGGQYRKVIGPRQY